MSTLYVTDLDGTLMRDDKTVSEYTVQVLNHLIEKGVFITYATARSIVSSSEIVKDVHFSIPVITKNGAVLANHKDASEVEVAGFSSEELAKLREILMNCGLDGIVTEHENGVEKKKMLHYATEGLQAYVKEHENDPRMCFVKDEQELFSGELTYFVYIASKDELEPIYQKLKKECDCGMVFQKDQYRDEFWLEIFPKDASKASAIEKVKKYCGCDEVVCFGDSINDWSMFQLATKSYAVGNAIEEIKAIATDVIGTNEEDGVAHWLAEIEKMFF